MTQSKSELVVTQGLALNIHVEVVHIGINRFSCVINHVTVCTSYSKAIARITTVYLASNKGK